MKVVHILVILLNSATSEPITVHILSAHTRTHCVGGNELFSNSHTPDDWLVKVLGASPLNGHVAAGVRCVYIYTVNGMDELRLNFQHLIL